MSTNRRNRNHNLRPSTANRANAQLSTGPKTTEGKAISSQNALRHGLTSKQIVLPGENPVQYDAQRETLHREYQPATETEHTLVDEIAACAWRLARARAVETAAYAKLIGDASDPAEALAEILIDRPKEITNIQRYVTSFERAYYRALNKLASLQKERAQQAIQEQEAKEETDSDGFVSQKEYESCDVDAELAEIEEELRYFQSRIEQQNAVDAEI